MQISDLGIIITGKTPSTKKTENWGGRIPFVTPKDIQITKHIFKTDRYISEKGLSFVQGSMIPKDAICVSCIGNLGYVGKTTQKCVSNQQINSIIVSQDHNPDYVFYLMKWLWQFFKNYEGQSTALSILNKTQFSQIEIPQKTRQEENAISKILSAIDDKIELNEEINKNLADQIRTLCNAWLNDYVPFGGKCPNDWVLTPLSSIAHFINGYSYKGNELQPSTVAMATIKNFDRKGGFKLEGYKEISASSKLKQEHHAKLFDTLVAHTDLTQNADIIGNAEPILSFAGYDDIIFSMDVVKVIPNNLSISKFLIAALLQTERFKSHCLGYINGTTVLHLSKKALSEYSISLPSNFDVLKPLDETVATMYKQMALNIDENTKLASLRDSLLVKLMSGGINVSNINI